MHLSPISVALCAIGPRGRPGQRGLGKCWGTKTKKGRALGQTHAAAAWACRPPSTTSTPPRWVFNPSAVPSVGCGAAGVGGVGPKQRALSFGDRNIFPDASEGGPPLPRRLHSRRPTHSTLPPPPPKTYVITMAGKFWKARGHFGVACVEGWRGRQTPKNRCVTKLIQRAEAFSLSCLGRAVAHHGERGLATASPPRARSPEGPVTGGASGAGAPPLPPRHPTPTRPSSSAATAPTTCPARTASAAASRAPASQAGGRLGRGRAPPPAGR